MQYRINNRVKCSSVCGYKINLRKISLNTSLAYKNEIVKISWIQWKSQINAVFREQQDSITEDNHLKTYQEIIKSECITKVDLQH